MTSSTVPNPINWRRMHRQYFIQVVPFFSRKVNVTRCRTSSSAQAIFLFEMDLEWCIPECPLSLLLQPLRFRSIRIFCRLFLLIELLAFICEYWNIIFIKLCGSASHPFSMMNHKMFTCCKFCGGLLTTAMAIDSEFNSDASKNCLDDSQSLDLWDTEWSGH